MKMDDDSTLKEFIKQYIAASGNQVYFTWQGGEPTLAGLDFFRKGYSLSTTLCRPKTYF
ncbi:putative arylsulfatase-activating protein [Escherichia coli]|uniref:Putative arylsulfatase-activating protein n=1 Tax=Escherichia coli TaxID=562 RepID=A0A377CVC4_ECOLX|nr:putative arylsulfatase-activating protein [Escherichia coli]